MRVILLRLLVVLCLAAPVCGCAQLAPRAPAESAEATLTAAETALAHRDIAYTESLLAQLQGMTLDPRQSQRLQNLQAELAFAKSQPPATLRQQPQIGETRPAAGGAARQLALLLPLSGAYAGPASAVRDGFLAAYFHEPEPRPALRLFDVGAGGDAVVAAYQAALNAGSDFIVGPLRKEDVAQIAALGQPPAPVLALNFLDGSAPFNFFQWGLAPEDEARQAAARAVAAGLRRAVALVPESEWGHRVLDAFQTQLAALGGQLLAVQTFAPGSHDFSDQIRMLLHLDESEERHRALTAILGVRTEFQPYRRTDVDFFFIAARPDEGRSIRPQIRFFQANDLPVYSTSLIFDGAPDQPEDLDGIRFCDAPWMLAPPGTTPERDRLATLFPDRMRESPRLFALGYDAYDLVRLIGEGRLQPGAPFPGASGELSLGGNGVIGRRLDCAELSRGAPQPLAAPPPP